MSIPKRETIRKNFRHYANKVGFAVHTTGEGSNATYCLFDMKMAYFTHWHISLDDLVRVVIDEMYMTATHS